MALKRTAAALCLACLLFPRAGRCDQAINPENAQADETVSVRDRLATSLFFRGELADMIIAADMAGRFINMDGIETNADARSALLNWIQHNPAKAAVVYLHLKSGAAGLPDSIETHELSWKFDSGFISRIKALNAAAGDKGVSTEALELAARRLYEGPQAEAEGPAVIAEKGGGSSGPGFFSGGYADYRLNKAGLDKELAAAGGWLDSVQSAGGTSDRYYGAAMSEYRDFLVAAAALKGRSAITAEEAAALEARRSSLRARLAALALSARAADLDGMASSLAARAAEPGAGAMAAAAAAMKARFDAFALKASGGGLSIKEISALAGEAEHDFSAFYLRYSVYNSLVILKAAASMSGYSCLYDYAVYRYLAAFFPSAAYPAARAQMAASLPAIDQALLKAGLGDIAGAFSVPGIKPEKLNASAALAASASAFNRRAQYFLWGWLFRPAELKAAAKTGRVAFRPAFTFFDMMERK